MLANDSGKSTRMERSPSYFEDNIKNIKRLNGKISGIGIELHDNFLKEEELLDSINSADSIIKNGNISIKDATDKGSVDDIRSARQAIKDAIEKKKESLQILKSIQSGRILLERRIERETKTLKFNMECLYNNLLEKALTDEVKNVLLLVLAYAQNISNAMGWESLAEALPEPDRDQLKLFSDGVSAEVKQILG